MPKIRYDLGQGWSVTTHDNGSMDFIGPGSILDPDEHFHLPKESVDKLREIFETAKRKIV